jgi:DNA-binding transcriptional ArsR family regulator
MNRLDSALSALSHPSRRAIIGRLSKQGPARVTEIAKPFDISLNAVSKHLKVLEQAGLVRREKIGRDHLIAFDPEPLREVARWIHTYEKYWTQQLDRLEDFFREKKKKGKEPK